jgi:prenyltransferase beta subunit
MIEKEVDENGERLPVWEWTAKKENRAFNITCQSKHGGFTKEPGPYHPDLLHAYFGVCGLSLVGFDAQLQKIDCLLGLTLRVRTNNDHQCAGHK